MKSKFHFLIPFAGLSLVASAVFLPLGGSAGASSPRTAGGVAAARNFIQKYVNPVTSIGNLPPLVRRPAKKSFVWLQGNEASTQLMTPGMQNAAKALGWKETTILFDPTNPVSVNSALLQAISRKPNYIALSGQPQANYQAALNVARSKGIPVFTAYSTETPQAKKNWLFSDVGGIAQWQLMAKIMGNYMIVDSNGTANTLFVSLSEYAVLAAGGPAIQQAYSAHCPGCTFASVDVSITQLVGGQIPSVIVSYLQAHPSVNYVYLSSGFLSGGLQAAMQTAGLSNIKVLSTNPQVPDLQAIQSGFELAGVGLPTAMSSWYIVDAMARYSVGMSLVPNWKAGLPAQIITRTNVPSRVYDGPSNFPKQFKKIWKVS